MDNWVKMKEGEKIYKHLDLVLEQKKLWNMRMTVIPVVIGALGMVPRALENGLEKLESRKKKNRNYPYL